MWKNKMILVIAVLSLLFFLGSGLSKAQAASFNVGEVSGAPADTVVVPINLTSGLGENVCAFNFDIIFDSNKLEVLNLPDDISIGPTAKAAGKVLQASQPKPGRIVIVVYGARKTIANGKVANINFHIRSGAAKGFTHITISDASAADPNARKVNLIIKNGKINIVPKRNIDNWFKIFRKNKK